MRKKERFGKFVLLDEIDHSGLGTEYRAAKLGNTGLEKIVSVLRLSNALSANGEAVKSLMDQVKFAAQLQNPNVVKIYGIGKVETSYYVSYEFLEGKSLRAIFNRCRQEGFPFSVDHALLIASKVCSALEYAHARKTEAGARYFHGHVTPASVMVSYEGEVRLRGFGSWPSRIREAGGVTEDELLYLSPEQSDGGSGDHRSDVFAVGLLLFETLTGEPFFQGGRIEDLPGRLAHAKLQSPTSDDDSLPKPIADILKKSLARDPAARYGEVQEMRKAVDTLLFSGDFTPTTFNLAFFMHSLFREDIEREAKALKEDKDASYVEYLTDAALSSTTGKFPVMTPEPEPRRPAGAAADATVMSAAHAAAGTPPPVPHVPAVHHAPAHVPAIAHSGSHASSAVVPAGANGGATDTPALTAREAAAGFTFHKDEKAKGKLPLVAGGVGALVLIGGISAWLIARSRSAPAPPPAPAPTTMSAEAEAAVARVKELEEKLKAIEAEKAAAEAKAADDTKKKMEAQAAAKGTAVDPAALQKAQEEAARKARAEQEKKAAEERQRLEEEKRAEEARLAEERRKAEEEAARVAAAQAAAATSTLAAPPTTTQPPAPALRAGTLVNLSDPGVIAPVAERTPGLVYPPIALRQRVEGTVELNVLVDEKGNVLQTQIVSGAAGKAGLNEAAVENVKKRRYRPASKDGVPVKVWVPVRVQFKLPS